jgi:hypothetical protein
MLQLAEYLEHLFELLPTLVLLKAAVCELFVLRIGCLRWRSGMVQIELDMC